MKDAVTQATRSADEAGFAVNNSKMQFRKEQRPYIWFVKSGMEEPQMVSTGEYARHLLVKVHFTNYGKSPAANVRADMHIAIGDKECTELRQTADNHQLCSLVAPNEDSGAFHPAFSWNEVDPNFLTRSQRRSSRRDLWTV